MDKLAQLVMTWGVGTLFMAALIFGFFPTFVVNVLVRVYPKGHPRRRELIAEMEAIPRRERLIWTAEQVATALFDAVPSRIAAVFKRADQDADEEGDETMLFHGRRITSVVKVFNDNGILIDSETHKNLGS